MNKHSFRATVLALAICPGSFTLSVLAQTAGAPATAPDVNYVTQTTWKFILPDGTTEDDMWNAQQEYFDKVISKSKLVMHYTVYRHAWGSIGASLVVTLEFDTWDDIIKFNQGERQDLENAAWPDEAARKSIMKKMDAFEDPYHRDEIFTVRNSMRK